MKDETLVLNREERVILRLRALYEGLGYKRYAMSKFEEYDFYAKNRDFIAGERILSFADADGKLMALKPDVTLSIVKNVNESAKLYYQENVYRVSRYSNEFCEIAQIGLENIGMIDDYANAETVMLAVKSLEQISPDYILDISHVGYLGALLASVTDDEKTRENLAAYIAEKNPHGLRAEAEKCKIGEEAIQKMLNLIDLPGDFSAAVAIISEMADSDAMYDAVRELALLFHVLRGANLSDRIRLDFSQKSDARYYNGLMLRGYVSGASDAVLSGGRYDPLMRKMGKSMQAIGFAIYFDATGRILSGGADDSDGVFIRYDDSTDTAKLFAAVCEHEKRGESVTAGKTIPENRRFDKIIEMGAAE